MLQSSKVCLKRCLISGRERCITAIPLWRNKETLLHSQEGPPRDLAMRESGAWMGGGVGGVLSQDAKDKGIPAGVTGVGKNWVRKWGNILYLSVLYSCLRAQPGEGIGNPLRNSWLENPMDRGAWWIVVYGVAQSRTRLKQLSSSSSMLSHSVMSDSLSPHGL